MQVRGHVAPSAPAQGEGEPGFHGAALLAHTHQALLQITGTLLFIVNFINFG